MNWHRVKCQSGLFGAFTAKLNSNRNWLVWDIIAGRAHNCTFTFAAKACACQYDYGLTLTKGLLFYINLSTSPPASALGLPGNAWGPADTAWLAALRGVDFAAVLPGPAAMLVHSLFCKNVLLPVSTMVQPCDSPRSVSDTSPGGAHILPRTGCKLISNTSSRDHSLPAGLTRRDKCRSRLSSQILEIAVWKQRCSSAARARTLTPRVLWRGPSWQRLKESGGHECIRHALQMPLRSCPFGDLGRGMPGSPAAQPCQKWACSGNVLRCEPWHQGMAVKEESVSGA